MNNKSIRVKSGALWRDQAVNTWSLAQIKQTNYKRNFFRQLGELDHGLVSIVYTIKESLPGVLYMTMHCGYIRKCVVLDTCYLGMK